MRRSSSSWSLSVMSQWKAVTPFAPKRANEAIETTAPITIIVVIIGSRSAVTSRDFSSGPANVGRAGGCAPEQVSCVRGHRANFQ